MMIMTVQHKKHCCKQCCIGAQHCSKHVLNNTTQRSAGFYIGRRSRTANPAANMGLSSQFVLAAVCE